MAISAAEGKKIALAQSPIPGKPQKPIEFQKPNEIPKQNLVSKPKWLSKQNLVSKPKWLSKQKKIPEQNTVLPMPWPGKKAGTKTDTKYSIDKYLEKLRMGKKELPAPKTLFQKTFDNTNENKPLAPFNQKKKAVIPAFLQKQVKVEQPGIKKSEATSRPITKPLNLTPPSKPTTTPTDFKKSAKLALMPKPLKKALEVSTKAKIEEVKELAKTFVEKQALLKKPISEIEKIPKKEITRVVKKERIEEKARGWYGDSLRHKKAAFNGWRLRKKITLHKLKKKEKEKKITKAEQKQLRELLREDKDLREKINGLNEKIKTLEKISAKKEKESKIIERKAKAAGITVPKAEKETARPSFRKMRDMDEFVEIMSRIADDMALATARQKTEPAAIRGMLSFDDQISAKKKLIKQLEVAFYKRKINFDQFRERLFDYQSELSEIRLQKEISNKRMGEISADQKGERMNIRNRPIIRDLSRSRGMELGRGGGIGISRKAEEGLERMAEKGIETSLKEKPERTAVENNQRLEEKIIGERTAVALQNATQSLNSTARNLSQASAANNTQRPTQSVPIQTTETSPVQAASVQPTQAIPTQAAQTTPWKKTSNAQTVQQPIVIREIVEVPVYPEGRSEGKYRIRRTPESERFDETGFEREDEKFEPRESKEWKKLSRKKSDKKHITLIERIRGKMGRESEKQRGISEESYQTLRQKAEEGGISKNQIDSLEQKLNELLRRYNIPENVVAPHLQTLDSASLLNDFQKLIGLIETKKENAATELIRPAPEFDVRAGIIAKKREKIVGKEKAIKKIKIETSFDMLLNLVQVKGLISMPDAAKQLGLNKDEIKKCAEILELNKLITLVYPPIGPVKLVYPKYLQWKEQEKKKQILERKKK